MTRRLVLTLDAFGTLIRPREPIAKQYADLARQHGLSGFTDKQVEQSFAQAFKRLRGQFPNYGKSEGMDPTRWWTNVIERTFNPSVTTSSLPTGLVPDLLNRFSTRDGYELCPDAPDFFLWLRRMKNAGPTSSWNEVIVGILTNSDDRVLSVLRSLGLEVSPTRFGGDLQNLRPESKQWDIDFGVYSHDVGIEKPESGIFNAAKSTAKSLYMDHDLESDHIHIGDHVHKDYEGAEKAGWLAILLGGYGRPWTKQTVGQKMFAEDLIDAQAMLKRMGNG